MKLNGAIFDLDGTLLDSMCIWDTIGSDYLIAQGIEPRENLNETFKSMSLLQAAEYYQSEYGLTKSTDEIMDGVNAMIEAFYFHQARPKDGVQEFLEQLASMNVRMCIATATDRHLVEAALKRNGLLQHFSRIFTCTEVGFGKNVPDIYMQALKHLGTDKQNTLVFEDAVYAVRTAKQAGFAVAGICDRFEKRQDEIRRLADYYVNSFAELGEMIA